MIYLIHGYIIRWSAYYIEFALRGAKISLLFGDNNMKKLIAIAIVALLTCLTACSKDPSKDISATMNKYADIVINNGDDCAKVATELDALTAAEGAALTENLKKLIGNLATSGKSEADQQAAIKAAIGISDDKTAKMTASKCMTDPASLPAVTKFAKAVADGMLGAVKDAVQQAGDAAPAADKAKAEALVEAGEAAIENAEAAAAAAAEGAADAAEGEAAGAEEAAE